VNIPAVDQDDLLFYSRYNPSMPLGPGTKLAGYEILGLLGAGGMGEVYRARDPVLKREVAIKVLPSFVSRDPDRLRRFEQEAQAAAALNHPNILAIHQFGVFEGAPYLVSELLIGESLREALQRGPLSVRKAIDYGIQISHGLAAAHHHGIVHRDLKPDNLFVTKNGHVKILDFGLAKLARSQEPSDVNSAAQTMGTDPGMVMGTAGYMSPEQVRGQPVDQRTDIFAFGAILYEMLTGRRAFQRSTSVETMTAILNDDPPAISQSGAIVPTGLHRVVNRCLEKDREQRFHSASDLAFALDALSDSGASPLPTAQKPSAGKPRRALVWPIAGIVVIALAAVAWFVIENRNGAAPLTIADYAQLTHSGHAGSVIGTDGSRLYLQRGLASAISEVSASGGEIGPVPSINLPDPSLLDISPDGSTLLVESYEKNESFTRRVHTVQLVGGSHRYLADAIAAAWSPDGKRVAYSTQKGEIDIINSDGTDAHKLASLGDLAFFIRWSPDGATIRFFRQNSSSLWEITSSGSNLHPLLADWRPSWGKCCGRWSPDGRFYVFLAGPPGPESQIYALDERHGLFHRRAKEPFQLTSGPIQWDSILFSKDGKKIFATGSAIRSELVRLDPKSHQFQPFLSGISADLLAFSKDGQSVAYVSYPDDILWKANRDGSNRIQLTNPPLYPLSVDWSPDGTQIAFQAQSPQGYKAWIVPSSGGTPRRLLPDDNGQQTDPSWSPDGTKMIFATNMLGGSSHESYIRILDLASHQVTTLPGSDGKFSGRWSPDGRFIKADSLDISTIYIFDVKTKHWSTLYKGVFAFDKWSSDSRYLYFIRYATDKYAADPAILRVPVPGGKAQAVVDLKDFPFTGTFGLWFGLDPTDAPMMLRNESITDVYAMTLGEK
jgi:serine/threonine protein kinase/Tol biopolymer transport system component